MIKNRGIFYCGGFNFNTPNNEWGVTTSGTEADRLQETEDAHLVRTNARLPEGEDLVTRLSVFEHLRFL